MDKFESDFGSTTGLIPGFAFGANENSGGDAGEISKVSAGGGASPAAALEAETKK